MFSYLLQKNSSNYFEQHGILLDEKLGTRRKPFWLGHDAWGYRNASVPDSAEIVAIGDSMTWGVNATENDTWPNRLQYLIGKPVYNISLGGWGPSQYLILIDQALQLKPKWILVAIYTGNDFFDPFHQVYNTEVHSFLRLNPIPASFDRSYLYGKFESPMNDFITQFMNKEIESGCMGSKVIRILRSASWFQPTAGKDPLREKAALAWAKAFPDRGMIYKHKTIGTVMTPAHRLHAINMDQAEIREGLRLTLELIGLMDERLRKTNCKLMVLVIPTKEYIYGIFDAELKTRMPPGYLNLFTCELKAMNMLSSFLSDRGIVFCDPSPYLVEGLKNNIPMYPRDDDRHPLPEGYSQIAAAVTQVIKDQD